MKTKVLCIYETRTTAEIVATELMNYGIPHDAINISREQGTFKENDIKPEESHSKLKGWIESMQKVLEKFFHSVIDTDEKEMAIQTYLNALHRGHFILSVDAENTEQATEAARIMNNFKSIHFLDLLYSYDHESRMQKTEAELAAHYPEWKRSGKATQYLDSSVHIFKTKPHAVAPHTASTASSGEHKPLDHDIFKDADMTLFDKPEQK